MENSMFNTATEFNLAMKIANIVDDAVKTKTGISASDLILSDMFYGRRKKIITAGIINTVKAEVQRLLASKAVNAASIPAKIAAMVAAIYGSYALGERMGDKVRQWLHIDTHGENMPDPYENISDRRKFDENRADRSREVSPGWYEPEAKDSYLDRIKMFNAGESSGIPANFGIAPGFSVETSPKKNNLAESIKQLQESNYLSASINNNKREITAQSGNFTSESIDPIQGVNLNSDVANWVQPTGFEQFLAESAGPWRPGGVSSWAASPTPSSAFYDPSGSLGSNKPMEFRPPGAGQDFAVVDPIAYNKGILEAFNQIEPQREAAKSIWRMRQINLLEQNGVISPQEAAKNKQMIIMALQTNPELGAQVDQIIQNNISGQAFAIPGESNLSSSIPEEQINWEYTGENPLNNPMHRALMDKAMTAVDEYQKSPLYQNAVGQSEIL